MQFDENTQQTLKEIETYLKASRQARFNKTLNDFCNGMGFFERIEANDPDFQRFCLEMGANPSSALTGQPYWPERRANEAAQTTAIPRSNFPR